MFLHQFLHQAVEVRGGLNAVPGWAMAGQGYSLFLTAPFFSSASKVAAGRDFPRA